MSSRDLSHPSDSSAPGPSSRGVLGAGTVWLTGWECVCGRESYRGPGAAFLAHGPSCRARYVAQQASAGAELPEPPVAPVIGAKT